MLVATLCSPLGLLQIVNAGAADLPTAIGILDEAAVRLQKRRIAQWASPPPPGLVRLLEREIADNHLYLVRLVSDTRCIGLFRLRWADAYWSAMLGEAGYLYSFALCNDACGYGIGQQLLGWIGEYLRRRHCRYLRLDCVAFNARLRQYYEDLGFVYCGQVVDGDYTLALYQLTL